MSTLSLIRHGQSAPFGGVASPLTLLGETQAIQLADYWIRHGVRFDEVHTGCLLRQLMTEKKVAQRFREASEPWPEAQPDAAWNEYDGPGILDWAGEKIPSDLREYQKTFERAMVRWLEGPVPDSVECWPAYRDRITGALRKLMAGPASRRVVIFTSGGPVGLSAQTALHAPDRTFLELNWRVRNTSVTEFLFDRERLTLESFNGVPHLDDANLRTYR